MASDKAPLKRRREEVYSPNDSPSVKRIRPSLDRPVSEPSSYIEHWVKNAKWPKEAFEAEGIRSRNMALLARRKSTYSLRRKRSESSVADSSTPSDRKPREAKSSPYTHPGYPMLLERAGVCMTGSELGVSVTSKKLCRDLLNTECGIP